MVIARFESAVPDDVLINLRQRLRATRWPDEIDGAGWDYGVPLPVLRDLVDYWERTFDWREVERRTKAFPNVLVDTGEIRLHAIHARGTGPSPIPLLIAHGWPSSFLEMLDLIPLLTNPAAHGGDAADAFDVVVPSLPGYGFSERPMRRGFSYGDAARSLRELMAALGYSRFGAHGHDHGAAILGRLAVYEPERFIGYHTSEPGIAARPDPADPTLSDAEREYFRVQAEWQREDDGYARIQATRPQRLAYGLTDSPAGLAAWLLDKWQVWTAPPGGDLTQSFSGDTLLANVTLYWLTGTANSSARAYYEGAHPISSVSDDPLLRPLGDRRITVPTGVALVATQPIERIPREMAARRFTDIRHWVELPRGGHFIAGEEPELLADSIRAFFRPLR